MNNFCLFVSATQGKAITVRDNEHSCILCRKVVGSDRAAAKNHLETELHQVNDRYAKAFVSDFLCRAVHLQLLLAELGGGGRLAESLRSRLLASLFKEPGADSLEELLPHVRRFKRNAALSLLELKLWKTACLLNPPRVLSDMTSFFFWMDSGWKMNKAAMRHHELITVVMDNVVPFLDAP